VRDDVTRHVGAQVGLPLHPFRTETVLKLGQREQGLESCHLANGELRAKSAALDAKLQTELLDRELSPTPEAADEALLRFAIHYDYHRLNGAIGWQTPAERWDGTPFTDHGFEHGPALEHLQGWLAELMAA
jgi:hypothetical protein